MAERSARRVPDELVEQLRAIEERLRDLAYDALAEAVEAGATSPGPEQRRLERARRAVEKAIRDLVVDEAGE